MTQEQLIELLVRHCFTHQERASWPPDTYAEIHLRLSPNGEIRSLDIEITDTPPPDA